MISFIDDQRTGDQTGEYLPVVEELERQNLRIIHLMQTLQSVDSGIRTSKQFIKQELLTGGNTGGAAQANESSGGDIIMT